MSNLRGLLKIKPAGLTKGSAKSSTARPKSSGVLKYLKQEDTTDHLVTHIHDNYLEKLNGKFINWNGEGSRRDSWGLHPSSIAGCPRALQYSWLGVKKQQYIGAKLSRIFSTGHYLHHMIQSDLERAGLMVMKEVPFIYEDFCLNGNADGLLRWPDGFHAIAEIKTINPRDFATLAVPSEEYIWQAQTYMLGLEDMRKRARAHDPTMKILPELLEVLQGIDNGLNQVNFYYLCKGTSATKEFIIKRDKKIVIAIKEKANTIITAMEKKKLLPRLADGPTESPCNRCDFKSKCFDRFNSVEVDWSRYERN